MFTRASGVRPDRLAVPVVGGDGAAVDLPDRPPEGTARAPRVRRQRKILVLDVGGSNVKVHFSGQEEVRKIPSGRRLTPERMVRAVLEAVRGWEYDAVSLGIPGVVDEGGPVVEPKNLGKGWVGYDFAAAFGRPVKVINDAAMQALGSYEGGRMLFLGLGTGLGSTLISDRIIVPLEIGQLPFRDATMEDYVKKEARKRWGDKPWQQAVADVVGVLKNAFAVDYVMLGGGNAKHLRAVPPGARLGGNENAFVGGFRLWNHALRAGHCLGIPRLKRPSWQGGWRVV